MLSFVANVKGNIAAYPAMLDSDKHQPSLGLRVIMWRDGASFMDGSLTLDLVCMDKVAHHGNLGPRASKRVDHFSLLHV